MAWRLPLQVKKLTAQLLYPADPCSLARSAIAGYPGTGTPNAPPSTVSFSKNFVCDLTHVCAPESLQVLYTVCTTRDRSGCCQASTMHKVHLLDYVAGNVRSLVNAIEKIGYEVEWIRSPEEVANADVCPRYLVLQ